MRKKKLYVIRTSLINECCEFLANESKKKLAELTLAKHEHVGDYVVMVNGMENWIKRYRGFRLKALPYTYTLSLEKALFTLKNFDKIDWSVELLYHTWDSVEGDFAYAECRFKCDKYVYNLTGTTDGHEDALCTYACCPDMRTFVATIDPPSGIVFTQEYTYNENDFSLDEFLKYVRRHYLGYSYYIYFRYWVDDKSNSVNG